MRQIQTEEHPVKSLTSTLEKYHKRQGRAESQTEGYSRDMPSKCNAKSWLGSCDIK